ncbi:sigma-70 family RNA polymerase sigma factor [Sporosarcina trichiuri]|uniref:sigma-70 family RNA polymerase sigma factor n=1 Tax=Sporosarcina trichiuri TaxID=3056445 RepID=UPI0025B51216|nr:sigma-70 family RNA polymerase sigma factor [Sporosarcina sp. 0.2-SM1T-5]WJY27067.1 sigma-70 family RNA polymerase sigma factor [Sporosarcina sp. 0.2-SM1T-5]
MGYEKKVIKAIGGDREALLYLIQQQKEKIYRTGYSYVGNKPDALDIFQQTALLAIESIHQLREPRYFSTWLMKICINVSLDVLQKQKKIVLMDDLKMQSYSMTNTKSDEKIDLLNAIYHLDEKYKTVLILKYYEDLTFEQIANALDEPLGTVKSNGKRGLSKLKTMLKGVYTDERAKSF